MIAITPEPVIGIPGTLIGMVRNPQEADSPKLLETLGSE
jgi:hypothetical protein